MKFLMINLALLFCSPTFAQNKDLKVEGEFKYFVDTNMPGVNFEGKATSFDSARASLVESNKEVKLQNIELELSADKLNSGIEMRDKHTQEKIFAPTGSGSGPVKILLKIKEAKCTGEKDKYSCTGEGPLKIGSKEITKSFTINLGKDGEVKSDFDVNLSAFGIKPPTYMGVEVNDQVKIQFAAKSKNL